MFIQYYEYVGDDIESKLNSNGISIYHNKSYYDEWGIDYEKLQQDVASKKLTDVCFAIRHQYIFVSDWKTTKYYTEGIEGKNTIWNYDFNVFFPVRCRPTVSLVNADQQLYDEITRILNEEYSKGICVYVPHPMIPVESFIFKVISNLDDSSIYDSSISTISNFEYTSIPWSYGRKKFSRADLDKKRIQRFAMAQMQARFKLCEGSKEYYNAVTDDGEKARIAELILSLNQNRIESLKLIGIPEQFWNIKTINYIKNTLYDPNGKCDLWGIIASLEEEEAIKRKKQEEEFWNNATPIYADSNGVVHEGTSPIERRDSYDYDDYDDYGGRSSASGFISNLAANWIANQGVKKAIREQTASMERMERERAEEQRRRDNEERRRRAYESQAAWREVYKANEERRRKGLPELPYPVREYW